MVGCKIAGKGGRRMDRLISADTLKKKINALGYVSACVDCCTKHEILEIIDDIPIAYDVDKVVEQLNDIQKNYIRR